MEADLIDVVRLSNSVIVEDAIEMACYYYLLATVSSNMNPFIYILYSRLFAFLSIAN